MEKGIDRRALLRLVAAALPSVFSSCSYTAAAAAASTQEADAPSKMADASPSSADPEDNDISRTIQDRDVAAPLLSCYDPYHETTYYVQSVGKVPTTADPPGFNASYHYPFSAKLNYQDFSPSLQCPGFNTWQSTQTFQDLVEEANSWLRQNPDVRVRCCETMYWWTNEPIRIGDTEHMVCVQHPEPSLSHNSSHCQHTIQPNILPDDTIYTVGLRLWLVPVTENEPQMQIGFRDFYPEWKDRPDNFPSIVFKANAYLVNTGIPGSLLTTESLFSPHSASNVTSTLIWKDSQCPKVNGCTFLRVFYSLSQRDVSFKYRIGVKDFCPEILNDTYEPFSQLVTKAGEWMNANKGYTVTNYKSLYVTKKSDCASDASDDRCQHQSLSWDSQQYFQILRVFYTHWPCPEPNNYISLNYVTITPVQLQPGPPTQVSFESMKQSMVRLQAWLKAAGADVFTAECLTTPIFPKICQSLPEMTFWTPSQTTHAAMPRKSLMYIRVYILGKYKEPRPSQLPPLPYSLMAEIMRREEHLLYKRKQRKNRRRRILFAVCFIILTIIGAVILFDRIYNFIDIRQ